MIRLTPSRIPWDEYLAMHLREAVIVVVILVLLLIGLLFVEIPGGSALTGNVMASGKPVVFGTITVLRSMTRLIAINNAVPALKDLRVRQALNYAVDSQAVNEMASEGVHTAANQYTPPISEGYSKDIVGYPTNVAKAKELLAQAGYTKDHPLVLSLTYISEGVISRIATAVHAMLQEEFRRTHQHP